MLGAKSNKLSLVKQRTLIHCHTSSRVRVRIPEKNAREIVQFAENQEARSKTFDWQPQKSRNRQPATSSRQRAADKSQAESRALFEIVLLLFSSAAGPRLSEPRVSEPSVIRISNQIRIAYFIHNQIIVIFVSRRKFSKNVSSLLFSWEFFFLEFTK